MTRFRFTIRELLLLTAIVAMSCAWWVDRSRLSSRVDELETEIFGRDLIDALAAMKCLPDPSGR